MEVSTGAHDFVFPDDDCAVMAGRPRSENRRQQFLRDRPLDFDCFLNVIIQIFFALNRDQRPHSSLGKIFNRGQKNIDDFPLFLFGCKKEAFLWAEKNIPMNA